jgi:hypothetical protein
MAEPPKVPAQRALSPTMRVDVMISDWRGEILPELSTEEKERQLYAKAWEAYLEGDYGFGLWCWHETDRLTNALNGSVREVTRVLGQERFLGFSHRRALAEAVPLEKVYHPRKGDMSRPRVDAIVLPSYQLLCVYAVRARSGDVKAKAQLEIALGELAERSRADPFVKHFESFQRLLDRSTKAAASAPDAAGSPPP